MRGDLKNRQKMKDMDKKKTLDDKEIIKVKPSKGEKKKKTEEGNVENVIDFTRALKAREEKRVMANE